jgi:hypothetical protein
MVLSIVATTLSLGKLISGSFGLPLGFPKLTR